MGVAITAAALNFVLMHAVPQKPLNTSGDMHSLPGIIINSAGTTILDVGCARRDAAAEGRRGCQQLSLQAAKPLLFLTEPLQFEGIC